mgnify:CR=1 FL=1
MKHNGWDLLVRSGAASARAEEARQPTGWPSEGGIPAKPGIQKETLQPYCGIPAYVKMNLHAC